MIDIKLLRENPEKVTEDAKNKGFKIDVSSIVKVDEEVRKLSTEVQKLHQERNQAAKEKNMEEGKKLKEELKSKEARLKELSDKLEEELYKIPNLPAADVKIGKNESENEVIKKYKEPSKLDLEPKDHLQLGELLDIIDVKSAAAVSGTRFAYLKNEAALLEGALVQLAFRTLTKEGFIPVVPPVLIKTDIMRKLGYSEQGGSEDMFHLDRDELTLVGTAEHAIVPIHTDQIFDKKNLPKRYVGFSSAFRREAGSYGKDTRGIFRAHQFDKVEMVSFTTAEESDKEHEYLLSLEEKLFQLLEIPYQVVKMCTGDLGFPTARKYDIEAWIPSQNKYREVTSVSTVTDFQSRRLNIKYRDGDKKEFVHILNGTAFAIGRTLVAILENYQQEDGSVIIPKVLQPFVGLEKISSK